jgi:lipopolysaccharide assembly outer membrane protein LptD (OstA)
VAHNATLYVGDVPIFYFPYYSRSLGPRANHFNFLPGYRSQYGPFLLTTYSWYLNEQLDGVIHADYRERRGPGVGLELDYHFGPWGDGNFGYYYTYDNEPTLDVTTNNPIAPPHNRQALYFSYQANPATNLYLKALAQYQSDSQVAKDFFEGRYKQNSQPNTFVEANKFWQNFSLDALVQPRLNDFLQTLERLPDVRLTGFRQQIGATPLFYESESSAGYYRQRYPETNILSLDYEAARADTFHQLLLPATFFGWLNVTPRVGGRFTYYSQQTGYVGTNGPNDEVTRGVFNTGVEVSFKASRLWAGAQNSLLDVDGVRHIIQPSVEYAWVPAPNARGTNEIPQFDSELPSLRLLPIQFPDYNSIDSINSQNVIRMGLRNTFQTKRDGQIQELAYWNVYGDWNLRPDHGQTTFSDAYSDLALRPRSWITFESQLRYDIAIERLSLAFNSITLRPNDIWSWYFGHFYLRDDFSPSPTALGEGNNQFLSSLYFRLNENYGFRASHHFDIRNGKMDEQDYTLYRDMRSWTAALSLRWREQSNGSDDFTVAFTFSIKAHPRYGLGSDVVRPYSLFGG